MQAREYTIRGACSDRDLHGILQLQAANLPQALAPQERADQGFVTVQHDFPLLREMNSPWPHVVASPVGADEIAAYALVMLERFRQRLPLLIPMFERMARLPWRGRPLGQWRWYVMGQLCVAKAHRGQGLVERLYAQHRAQMAGDFDVMVTEVDRANTRSMRVHEKAGCVVIDEYREGSRDWAVVALDLGADHASA